MNGSGGERENQARSVNSRVDRGVDREGKSKESDIEREGESRCGVTYDG